MNELYERCLVFHEAINEFVWIDLERVDLDSSRDSAGVSVIVLW